MDIYFSDLDRNEIYLLPCLPSTMPEISKSSKNEEFETYDEGVYNIIGNKVLATFSIDCWLPEYASKYSWAKSQINPYDLINLWETAMTNKKPIRCVLVRGANKNNISPVILNWMVTVENYTQIPADEAKDIHYKIDLKEYRSLATGSNTSTNSLTDMESEKVTSTAIATKLNKILA